MSNLSLIYKEIQKEYDFIRSKNNNILILRKQEVGEKIPEYRDICDQIADLSIQEAKSKIFNINSDSDEYSNKIAELVKAKERLLITNGYPADYLSPIFNCTLCQDTGYIDGLQKCQCLNSKLIKARYAQSHIQSVLETENFSNFSYDYYNDEEKIEITKIVNSVKSFVDNFDNEYRNILFFGQVGTGKTYLSNCIAKELLDKGKTVLYFTAPGIFEMISSSFKKNSDLDSDSFYEDIFNCDLLILDDLGTESYNSFTVGQFFIILNERLSRRKSTVISTNMDIQKLKDLYSERSISRILGGYDMFRFKGQDLRIKKKSILKS